MGVAVAVASNSGGHHMHNQHLGAPAELAVVTEDEVRHVVNTNSILCKHGMKFPRIVSRSVRALTRDQGTHHRRHSL